MDDMPVESLVAGRTKRSTAGNRLRQLLDREDDDELAGIFAEDENDVEYTSAEDDGDASDVQLESSSDEEDEDRGAAAGDDDLEGEKELRKQARDERKALKRKIRDPFMKLSQMRKKSKTETIETSPQQQQLPSSDAARHKKKKSERFSFMPTPDEQPTRSSTRRQTVHNREQVLDRLRKGEATRIKILEKMEAAERRKNKNKRPPMTQADRLAEAARVEHINTMSLNRWEEAERKRVEEQKAKLEALRNRQLEGPAITRWSGLARWEDGKLVALGSRPVDRDHDLHHKHGGRRRGTYTKKGGESAKEIKEKSTTTILEEQQKQEATSVSGPEVAFTHSQEPDEPKPNSNSTEPSSQQSVGETAKASETPQEQVQSESKPPELQLLQIQPLQQEALPQSSPIQQSPKATSPLPTETTSRNLIVLQNFDDDDIRSSDYRALLMNSSTRRRATRLVKPVQPMCVITGQPAKYRDPDTGLPYYNVYAYQAIKRLTRGESRWSADLGCFVGASGVAATGVPEQFAREVGKHDRRTLDDKQEDDNMFDMAY